MDETALLVVLEYVDKNLFEPSIDWPKSEFQERSYARWTAFEIQQALVDTMWLPPGYNPPEPIDVILQFMVEIEQCLRSAKDPQNEKIFEVAKRTATEILYLFL